MTLQELCDFITNNFYDDYHGRIILKNKNKVLNVKGLNYLLKKFYKRSKECVEDEIC
jgi:hypothetical protein